MRSAWSALAGSVLLGCGGTPPSQFPTADAALGRMRETYACSRGVGADAKLDYFGDEGRARGNVLYKVSLLEKMRFSVYSPFGVMLSTLSSDGKKFALYDLRQKEFLHGPALPCNVERFTRVPVPPFALVQLLRGEAPVLVHEAAGASIGWERGGFLGLGSGSYMIRISSKHGAEQEIRVVPVDEDFGLPWNRQRLRVLEVRVLQHGSELYAAELRDHRPGRTAPPRADEDGLAVALPPSGPSCTAELPARVRISVPDSGHDLLIVNEEAFHNPPLTEGDFTQSPPSGVRVRYVTCGG
jgi:hypothetical protein